jgi:hypothetical protein
MTSKVSQEAIRIEGMPTSPMALPDPGTPEFAQMVRQMQTAQQQFQQQQQQEQQRPQRRVAYGGKSVDELRMLSDILDDIQDQLEPIRDRVLDEKARLTGYAQCAEAFIKIIAARAGAIKKRAVEQAKEERAEAAKPKPKRASSSSRSRKKPDKEAKPGGHDSAEKQRGSS